MFIQSSGIYCFLFLVKIIFSEKLKSEKCMHMLNNYIKKDLKPYQVVLLTNLDIYLMSDNEITTVLRNLPFVQFDVQKMSAEELKQSMKSQSFGILRKTSLFLLVNSFDTSTNSTNISLSLKYLSNLSPGKDRPKVLQIFMTNRQFSFENFLYKMWSSQFLDFTILEIRTVQQKSYFQKLDLFKSVLYYYNPFRNRYFRKTCSLGTVWFPKKLLNLYGYPIIAGVALRPPYSIVRYDRSGLLIEQKGADLKMFNALSEAMNFSILIDSNVNSSVGVFRGKKASGMLGKLIENKINLLITSVLNFRPNADGALYGYSATIEMESFVALVPILHRYNVETILNFKVLFTGIVLFIGFIFLMWLFLRYAENNEKFWIPEYIAALLLGVTIDDKPTLNFNRIIFICFIAIGICFSSFFLGGITANQVKETETIHFKSLKDLGNSSLVPIIHPNFFNQSLDDSEEIQNLKRKTISTELVDTLCPLMLVRYKNVTCLLMNAYAKQLAHAMRDSSGLPIAEIMDKSFFIARRTIVIERNSPYKERYDQIITIFIEAGLRLKWSNNVTDHNFIFKSSELDEKKLMNAKDLGAVSKLGRIILLVTLPGYLLSFLAFCGELLFNKFFKKIKKEVEIIEIDSSHDSLDNSSITSATAASTDN